MPRRLSSIARAAGLACALAMLALAAWHAMRAPAPEVHLQALSDGGRVAGIDCKPLFLDADRDGIEEVIFWRSSASTLVAMSAESGRYVWESAPVDGGCSGGRAWVTRGGLFVADSRGGFSALEPGSGSVRYRRDLAARVTRLCPRSDAFWVSLTDERTLALDPASGEERAASTAAGSAALPADCEPTADDRLPGSGSSDAELGDVRWLLTTNAGADELPPAAPEPIAAKTRGAAFVAFTDEGRGRASVAGFDLPTGRRRWKVHVVPDGLAAIAANDRHVALTWKAGALGTHHGRDFFALMILNAETGEKVSHIGYASHSRP